MDALGALISAVAGSDVDNQPDPDTASHIVAVMPESGSVSDTLMASAIVRGTAGAAGTAAYDFGVDPDMDPELALVMRHDVFPF